MSAPCVPDGRQERRNYKHRSILCYELLKIDEEDNEWKIFESDKIFSQEVRFKFVDDYDDVGLSGYHYKGEVASYGDLPSDADIDDVYSVENVYGDTVFYVKTGTGWTELTECGGTLENLTSSECRRCKAKSRISQAKGQSRHNNMMYLRLFLIYFQIRRR